MGGSLPRITKVLVCVMITVGVLIVLFLNINKNMSGFECPKYTPPSPDFCKDGIIITGLKDFRGCNLPPYCFKSVSMKPPLKKMNNSAMISNPAAVYCEALGYKFKILNEEKGQRGYCIFPDNSNCTAWSFFAGECGKEWSYCERYLGGKIIGYKPCSVSTKCAVCKVKLDTTRECLEWNLVRGFCRNE